MRKGNKSIFEGVENALMPFTYVGITQGAGIGTHKGTKAFDIGYKNRNNPYEPYYAPCKLKCIWTYPINGQSMWQSVSKVRLANGQTNYITLVLAHDSSFNAYVGQVINQGVQLGNKGNKGASGVHCHIEVSLGRYTVNDWKQNSYGIWCMPNEIPINEVFFIDNTEIHPDDINNYKWNDTRSLNTSKNSIVNAYGEKITVGSRVSVRSNYIYGGKSGKFAVNYKEYDVLEVSGTRVVIGIGTTVTAPVHCDNLHVL